MLFWFSSFPGLLWLPWIGFSDTGFFLFHFVMILFYTMISEKMSTMTALPAEWLTILFDCSSIVLLALTVERSVPPWSCLLTLTVVTAVRVLHLLSSLISSLLTWRPVEQLNSCYSHLITLTLPSFYPEVLLLLCCFSHLVHLFSTLLLCRVQSLIFWPCLSFAVLEVRRHKIVLNNSQIAAVMWLFAHWKNTYKHSNAITTT